MSEKVVPADVRSVSSASESTRRSFWSSRTPKIAFVSLVVGLAACGASMDSGRDIEGSEQLVQLNECAGEAANTFFCTDDNSFAHCVGGGSGFPKDCAPGVFCIQQDNPVFNPCVGLAPAQAGAGNNNDDKDDDVVVEEDNDDDVVVEENNDDDVVVDNGNNNNDDGVVNNDGTAGTFAAGAFFGDQGIVCQAGGSPGVPFDQAGLNAKSGQFITGRCLSNADCVSGCCAKPCGVCSGPDVGNVAPKTGCGFVFDFAAND